MLASGYLQRAGGREDARARPVVLIGRGRELLATVEQIYAELKDS